MLTGTEKGPFTQILWQQVIYKKWLEICAKLLYSVEKEILERCVWKRSFFGKVEGYSPASLAQTLSKVFFKELAKTLSNFSWFTRDWKNNHYNYYDETSFFS